jgi:hypothetical protein
MATNLHDQRLAEATSAYRRAKREVTRALTKYRQAWRRYIRERGHAWPPDVSGLAEAVEQESKALRARQVARDELKCRGCGLTWGVP